MTKVQKLIVEHNSLNEAEDSGDLIFMIDGVTETEAREYLTVSIKELSDQINEIKTSDIKQKKSLKNFKGFALNVKLSHTFGEYTNAILERLNKGKKFKFSMYNRTEEVNFNLSKEKDNFILKSEGKYWDKQKDKRNTIQEIEILVAEILTDMENSL